jgi:mannose-6-phosphate isomerase-like protein (cupin superfamily)
MASPRYGLLGNDFRKVLFTSPLMMQLVSMNLRPNQSLGLETHPKNDQLFIIVSGEGDFQMGDGDRSKVVGGSVVLIPAGTPHNLTNISSQNPLRLLTAYSPAVHPDGLVQTVKPANH